MVHRKNAELADLAETAANEAERLLANAKRALRKAKIDAEKRKANGQCDAVTGRRRGRLVRAVNDLTELLDATRKIVEQTRERLAGRIPDGATRQVSLHDPDAGQSERAGSGNLSSSATRLNWSTTTTASSSTTTCSRATRPMDLG